MLVEHNRKPGTPTTNETLDKEIITWAEANVDASEREEKAVPGNYRGITLLRTVGKTHG